jgi:hypothetical protein
VVLVPQAIIVVSSKQLPFCGLVLMVDFEWDSLATHLKLRCQAARISETCQQD